MDNTGVYHNHEYVCENGLVQEDVYGQAGRNS